MKITALAFVLASSTVFAATTSEAATTPTHTVNPVLPPAEQIVTGTATATASPTSGVTELIPGVAAFVAVAWNVLA
jgi:hypothetical protein